MLERVTTGSVCDALMKRGLRQFMAQRIRALGAPRLAGRALTIRRDPVGVAAGTALPNARMVGAIDEAPQAPCLFSTDTRHTKRHCGVA